MPRKKPDPPPGPAYPPHPHAPPILPHPDPSVFEHPMRFTSFYPLPYLNTKNTSSRYLKDENNTWSGRRAAQDALHARIEGKRPRVEGSEEAGGGSTTLQDASPAARTIVIHPGSRNLRIGRASDALPLSIPAVVARRTHQRTGTMPQPPPAETEAEAPPPAAKDEEAMEVDGELGAKPPGDVNGDAEDPDAPAPEDPFEAKLQLIHGDLRTRMRSYKLRGTTNGQGMAAAYNASVVPETVRDLNDPYAVGWTEVGEGEGEAWVGEEALKIPDPEIAGYEVRWPFRRGDFNTQSYDRARVLLGDVERLFTSALVDGLGVGRGAFKEMSVILVIPDSYTNEYVRELCDLLLNTLNFRQICLQQESNCAAFGAGLSSACVVDIGAQKTSVACVEEGIVLPESRMSLAYGGDDITVFFHQLLARANFPYREADLARAWDWALVQDLKERLITLSETDYGVALTDFYVRRPGRETLKYTLKTYDDVIKAPYALFATRVFDFVRKFEGEGERRRRMWAGPARVEEIDIGANPVTAAMHISTMHLAPQAPPPPPPAAQPLPSLTPAGSPRPELPEGQAPGSSRPASPAPPAPVAPQALPFDIPREASKMPLHVAVVNSIIATQAPDRVRRFAESLVVVGGTGRMRGVAWGLETRVQPLLQQHSPSIDRVQVIPAPRETDPALLAWKGVAVLARLDAVADLWVRREDWRDLGLKAIRDRTICMQ